MRAKDVLGRFGEQAAANYLTDAGWQVLARNWRCRSAALSGELDIVARDGSDLIFVEVKTRSSLAYGAPGEAVDRRKSARIRRLAVQWMDEYRREVESAFWSAVRFDVVCVLGTGADARLDHVVGSF